MTTVTHAIARYTFGELLAGLSNEVDSGNVKRVEGPDGLTLYNYTRRCVTEKAWNPFNRAARGLILHELSERVIALPFEKFFNYGEAGALPNEAFSVYDKLDGSLGIIYEYEGGWRVATRGAFASEQALWATEWLKENITPESLNPDITYLAEIVYPQNRIVVDYQGLESLVFLSSYNRKTFVEELNAPKSAGFRMAKTENHTSIDNLLELAKSLDANQEGFVVRFASGTRIKIKGDEYCRVHKLISEVTPLGVWRALAAGDNLAEIRQQIPEEYWRDMDAITEILTQKLSAFSEELREGLEEVAQLTDKELGLYLKSGEGKLSKLQSAFIFAARKQNLLETVEQPGMTRTKVFKTFRPTGNKLEGYRPTNVMNRFEEG